MTRVQGDLKIITGTAEAVTEVWVRSKVARPVPGGWLMTTNDRKPVFNGTVDLELLPGACVLVAVSSGLPGETVELIVPESGTASLEACIRAAEAAGDLERDALDELRRDFGAWLDEARASVSAAGDSAKAAKTSAENAAISASGAAGSADAAGSSAKAAKADADRAEGVVDSVRWNGDKLTVAGKTSPSLRGPKGERGDGARGVAIEGDGTDPQATGAQALALGWRAVATEQYSTAIGYEAQARGSSSIAVGRYSQARGDYSTAIGDEAQAEHWGSTAIGKRAVATDSQQTRIGNLNSNYHVSLAGDVRLTKEPERDDNAATKKYVDNAVQNNTTPPTWDKVEGKPSEFPPSAHKHTLADVTNAPNSHTSAATKNTLVSRDSGGRAQFATPTSTRHAATKGYVDERDEATLAAGKAYVDEKLESLGGGGAQFDTEAVVLEFRDVTEEDLWWKLPSYYTGKDLIVNSREDYEHPSMWGFSNARTYRLRRIKKRTYGEDSSSKLTLHAVKYADADRLMRAAEELATGDDGEIDESRVKGGVVAEVPATRLEAFALWEGDTAVFTLPKEFAGLTGFVTVNDI